MLFIVIEGSVSLVLRQPLFLWKLKRPSFHNNGKEYFLQFDQEICNNLGRSIITNSKLLSDSTPAYSSTAQQANGRIIGRIIMKNLRFAFLSVLCLLVLSSCGTETKTQSTVPKMLNVDLSISPEKGEAGQPVTFTAKVTQGTEKVNNADQVTFEIWRSMDKTHEKINIKHGKGGEYTLTKTFQQDGTYYIISHVTARGMHNMPKKDFVIGQPSEKEKLNSNSSMEGMNMK